MIPLLDVKVVPDFSMPISSSTERLATGAAVETVPTKSNTTKDLDEELLHDESATQPSSTNASTLPMDMA
jgi:hypothetical protein